MEVVTIEERHTSKGSFLDLEPIEHHDRYLGKRVKRGLFVASAGQAMHADVNASYNILRRYAPHVTAQGVTAPHVTAQGVTAQGVTAQGVTAQGVSGFLLRPVSLRLPDRRQDRNKQLPRRKARE